MDRETYSGARVGTRNGPASLGDPDPLAGGDTVDSVAGVLDRLPEDVCGVADGGVLEVGVAGKMSVSRSGFLCSCRRSLPVHADEVRSLDNNLVGAINPSVPGVNVTDLGLHANGADHASHIVNAVGESVRVAVLPVEILAADRDGKNPVLAVSRDGVEQSLLLSLEVVGVLGPDTDENLDAGVLGSRNGVGEGVAVGAGVEAHRGHVLREALKLVEGGGPLGSGLA